MKGGFTFSLTLLLLLLNGLIVIIFTSDLLVAYSAEMVCILH